MFPSASLIDRIDHSAHKFAKSFYAAILDACVITAVVMDIQYYNVSNVQTHAHVWMHMWFILQKNGAIF